METTVWNAFNPDEAIGDAILAAVAEEREECAKIADSYDCNEFLAKEIRERASPRKGAA